LRRNNPPIGGVGSGLLAGLGGGRDTCRAACLKAVLRRAMNAEEERELRAELERLKQEHRDLDSAIEALLAVPGYDRLQVQRLKKRKLQLRDRITTIEDQLFPDIIA
jgi:hypothetical protein